MKDQNLRILHVLGIDVENTIWKCGIGFHLHSGIIFIGEQLLNLHNLYLGHFVLFGGFHRLRKIGARLLSILLLGHAAGVLVPDVPQGGPGGRSSCWNPLGLKLKINVGERFFFLNPTCNGPVFSLVIADDVLVEAIFNNSSQLSRAG